MPRRERSFLDDIFEFLKPAPVWMGPALAAVLFVLFYFVVPLFLPSHQNGVKVEGLWRGLLHTVAGILAAGTLLAWAGAELWKWKNRRMLDAQTDIQSIRQLSWQDFERLVCEAYRRQGYLAQVVGNGCGDGGVDIELQVTGQTVLVQCKQWKAYSVGVSVLRELLGVVVSRNANRGIVVTSGRFTREAERFAKANPAISLVDGPKLAELIGSVQSRRATEPRTESASQAATAPICPQCGSQMALRTARRGGNAGSDFWGCPKYPACKGTRPTG